MVLSFSSATIAFSVYGPLLLTALHDVSALVAGYMVAASSIGWSVMAISSPARKERHDGTLILGGMGVLTVSILGFAFAVPYGPLSLVLVFALLEGSRLRACLDLHPAARHGAGIRRAETARAAAALPTLQQIGYALGAAYVGIVANAAGFADRIARETAEAVGFWIFAASLPLALIGLYAAWRFVRFRGGRRGAGCGGEQRGFGGGAGGNAARRHVAQFSGPVLKPLTSPPAALGDIMAEHTHSGPVELGAPMDYAAHRRTFAGFVSLTKITVLATIAILQSLTLFGLAGHGFWLGVLLILLMFIATGIGLFTKGSIKALVGVVIIGFVFMVLRSASGALHAHRCPEGRRRGRAARRGDAGIGQEVRRAGRGRSRSRPAPARPPEWRTSAIARPAPRSPPTPRRRLPTPISS